MPKDAKPLFPSLLTGQNDTRVEEGQELPRWPVVSNTRFKTGAPTRRPGMRRLAICGTDATSLDFTAASSQHMLAPAHDVHALGFGWTMEFLFNPDAVTGTQVLYGFAHATNFPFRIYLVGTALKVDLVPSTGATVTLTATTVSAIGTTQYARVTRDNDDLVSLYVNDGTTAEATSDAGLGGYNLKAAGGGLYRGRDNTGNYYDGQQDYFRAMSYVQPDNSMAFTRWPTPRASYMLWDYGGELNDDKTSLDRSQYENHAEDVTAPAVGTTLCVNPAPVQLMHSRRDKTQTRLLLIAGGRVHNVGV